MDITTLKGEDLFYFFTHDYEDKDYGSIVSLLQTAVGDANEAYSLLERVVSEDKKFIAVYPSVEDINTSNLEFVGSIPDGALYIR